MANIKIQINDRGQGLKIRKEAVEKEWKISDQDKKDLLLFLEDLELGKVNRGKKISKGRQLKYLDLLKIPLEFFDKPTSQLTIKNVEKFEKALVRKNYAQSTQASIRLMLRTYMKWKLGETPKFHEMTDWFDTRETKKTPDYLSEQEIDKLYKACKTNDERFIIAMLFDSGCRAEEFHNIRMEDIQLPEGSETYIKLTLKEEYSKTSGRVISLYWKNSLEAVRDFYIERTKEGIKSNEAMFKGTYDSVRQFLYRLSGRVFGWVKKNNRKVPVKPIHFHLFRHSSATHYAPKLNRQQLCYRYGWRFSSDMPDVYISRSGMESKELDEKFSSIEMEDLKSELEKGKLKHNLEMEELKKQQEYLAKALQALTPNPVPINVNGQQWASSESGLAYQVDDKQGFVPYQQNEK